MAFSLYTKTSREAGGFINSYYTRQESKRQQLAHLNIRQVNFKEKSLF
jgi:hypothetical protein